MNLLINHESILFSQDHRYIHLSSQYRVNSSYIMAFLLLCKYEFLTIPTPDLFCMVCAKMAAEPWQHGSCGRLLCKKCLMAHGSDSPCPSCKKQEAIPSYFQDKRSERKHLFIVFMNSMHFIP